MAGDSIDGKRVYGGKRGGDVCLVAAGTGIARVEFAAGQAGRFSLVRRCTATAVAAGAGPVAAGTDTDVLVDTGDGFAATGFGPAAAVGVDGDTVLAASPDGRVGRLDTGAHGDPASGWETLGDVTDPRRFDGSLLAADEGLYRADAGLVGLGLADVRDAAPGPYAATGEGLSRRASGEWLRELDRPSTVVAAADGRVHAVSASALLERDGGAWERLPTPGDGPEPAGVVDLAHGACLYAVTASGTAFSYADPDSTADGRGGWRSRALGLRDVAAMALL